MMTYSEQAVETIQYVRQCLCTAVVICVHDCNKKSARYWNV